MGAPRLGLHLTDRCQLDCQHCLRDPQQKPRDLPLSLIEPVLDQARAHYATTQVSLTGGEPTLHPHFLEIIAAIASRGMVWDMVTNGRGLSRTLARLGPERLRALRSLSLSLDGANESTHDSIREPGSYREVMAAAATCSARGLKFGIQMALNARNEAELEAVGLLAAQLGAKHVSFAMTQPTGTHHDAALYLSAAQWRTVLRRMEQVSRALAIAVVRPEGHYSEARFDSCGPFRSETLHVDVQGRLTLCCLHSGVPSGDPDSDLGGDLGEMDLVQAHTRLLAIVHREQVAKLAELDSPASPWSYFQCNRCLGRFGKPHWAEGGAVGPAAARERWRGAWAPSDERHAAAAATGPHRLTLVSK